MVLPVERVQGAPQKKYIQLKKSISNNKYLLSTHSTNIIIYIYKYNSWNFDNYQFFPLMTFLGKIIELYHRVIFLDYLMLIFNKETKNKASILKMQLTTEQGVFLVKRYHSSNPLPPSKRAGGSTFSKLMEMGGGSENLC